MSGNMTNPTHFPFQTGTRELIATLPLEGCFQALTEMMEALYTDDSLLPHGECLKYIGALETRADEHQVGMTSAQKLAAAYRYIFDHIRIKGISGPECVKEMPIGLVGVLMAGFMTLAAHCDAGVINENATVFCPWVRALDARNAEMAHLIKFEYPDLFFQMDDVDDGSLPGAPQGAGAFDLPEEIIPADVEVSIGSVLGELEVNGLQGILMIPSLSAVQCIKLIDAITLGCAVYQMGDNPIEVSDEDWDECIAWVDALKARLRELIPDLAQESEF